MSWLQRWRRLRRLLTLGRNPRVAESQASEDESVSIPAWPTRTDAFILLPDQAQDQPAQLRALALCNTQGQPAFAFEPGERMVVYVEWEIPALPDGQVLGVGLHVDGLEQRPLSPADAFRFPQVVAPDPQRPLRLRARYVVRLEFLPGEYGLSVELVAARADHWRAYQAGQMEEAEFAATLRSLARRERLVRLWIVQAPEKPLPARPLAALTEHMQVSLASAADEQPSGNRSAPILHRQDPLPALIHVTHQKAGSQWIYSILRQAFPDRIVPPAMRNAHFLAAPVQQGKIYPTVYLAHEQFRQARLPDKWVRFVIIRDLRDTMISAYFSIKESHPPIGPIRTWRRILRQLSKEDGLLWVMENWLPGMANIQASWLQAGERLLRYEDLLRRDVEILSHILLTEAGWPIEPAVLERIIVNHRFENIAGRKLGEEDVGSHLRKGAPGDWRNHFTPLVKERFKLLYGHLLIAVGYERDLDW